MGGGKSGGGCSTVGYGYTLSMAYALCESADLCSGYSWNGNIDYTSDLTTYGDCSIQLEVTTGKKGDPYASKLPSKSLINIYYNNKNCPVVALDYPEPQDVKINGICCALFKDAFVGDNTTQIPNYKFRMSRWTLNSNMYDLDPKLNQDINPIAIIYEILNYYLEIDDIDEESFTKAFNTCKEENLGVSFIMTDEKKVTDWIKEILRVVDGVLYFDTLTKKWKIFLIRNDYNPDDLFEINEYNASDIQITTGDWSNVITTFTFKYTNWETGQTESFTIENAALKQILGYEKANTYTYQLISNADTMNLIANRIIQKNGKPQATLKCKINIFDLPNIHLGQVIKVKSEMLNIPEMYFRIMKIGADKEYQTYVEIEATEDLFYTPDASSLITTNPPIDNEKYSLTIAPYAYKFFGLNNLLFYPNVETLTYYLVILVSDLNDFIINGVKQQNNLNGNIYTSDVYIYGKLENDLTITQDFDRDIQITIKDLVGHIYDFSNSDSDWQKGNIALLIDNELIFVKEGSYNSSTNTLTLKGLIRGVNGNKDIHNANTDVWLIKDVFDNTTYINTSEVTHNYDLWYYNLYSESDHINVTNYTNTDFIYKPLPVENPKIIGNKLYFSICLRGNLSGDLLSADAITAGEAESQTENYIQVNIYEGATLISTIQPNRYDTIIEYDVSNVDKTNIYIETVYKNIYKSDKVKAIII